MQDDGGLTGSASPDQQALRLALEQQRPGPHPLIGPHRRGSESKRWLVLEGHSWIAPADAAGVPVTAAQFLGGPWLLPDCLSQSASLPRGAQVTELPEGGWGGQPRPETNSGTLKGRGVQSSTPPRPPRH